jgi:hypothetical protein
MAIQLTDKGKQFMLEMLINPGYRIAYTRSKVTLQHELGYRTPNTSFNDLQEFLRRIEQARYPLVMEEIRVYANTKQLLAIITPEEITNDSSNTGGEEIHP